MKEKREDKASKILEKQYKEVATWEVPTDEQFSANKNPFFNKKQHVGTYVTYGAYEKKI